MDDVVLMRVSHPGTHLLDVVDRPSRLEHLILREALQVAASHIFEDEIMEDGTFQITGSTVTKAADNIRMPDPIESDCLVLKVLYERSLQIIVEVIAEQNIKRLDNDVRVCRLSGRKRVARDEDLGVASAT
jgi:hypothetical protein